jgi:chromosome segregation ATPase
MDTEDSQTISALKNEIAALKEQIKLSKEQETQSQQTLNKIKQIHKEFETSYLTAISEYKTIEENLKKQYFSYQSILENQFNQSEKRLNDQISHLKSVLKTKTDLITQLTKENSELKQTITQNEIDFNLKENEYENLLASKDKRLNELDNTIKEISEDAAEDLRKLSGKLEMLQVKMQGSNSNIINEEGMNGYVEGEDGVNNKEMSSDRNYYQVVQETEQ